MDIQSWMRGVVTEKNHGTPDRFGLADFLQPKQDVTDPVIRSRKRRGKSLSNASSFLEPLDPPFRTNLRCSKKSKPQPPRISTSPSDSGTHSLVALSNETSNIYRRKSRHKPRSEVNGRKESRKKRKRPKKAGPAKDRNKDEKRITRQQRKAIPSRIQQFHAKDVFKDRLTLRHAGGAGVFDNAKSSAMRRAPEHLAFSRMKYSRTAGEGDTVEQRPDRRQSKDIDKIRRREQEISAYFAPSKGPLEEKGYRTTVSGRAPSHGSEGSRSTNSPNTHSEHISIVVRTSEKPAKPLNTVPNDIRVAQSIPIRNNGTYSKSVSDEFFDFPRTAVAVRAGEFKFRPGPNRSSSLGVLQNAVNSTNQSNEFPMRRQSDELNYSENLSGETCSRKSRDVPLSGDSAQQLDKHPLSRTNRSAKNRIFEPQTEAPRRHHTKPERTLLGKVPAQNQGAHYSSCYRHQSCVGISNREDQHLKTLPEFSSSSAAQILEQCKDAERQIKAVEKSCRENASLEHKKITGMAYEWPYVMPAGEPDRQSAHCGDGGSDAYFDEQDYSIHFQNDRDRREDNLSINLENEISEAPSRPAEHNARAVRFAEPLDEASIQSMTHSVLSVNIPCVGGLNPEMLSFKDFDEPRKNHSPSFWKPNRLY